MEERNGTKMENVLTARLDKLDRDVNNLSTAVLRLSQSLSKLDPQFELHDKLKPISVAQSTLKPKPNHHVTAVQSKPKPDSSYDQ